MKNSSLLIGSLFFLFIISPSFATTCPPIEKINLALKKFETYLNKREKISRNPKRAAIKFEAKIPFYYSRVKDFKGAYYQEKTKDVKESSLTCMYTLKARNTYFYLKLHDLYAGVVDVTSFNKKYWDDFYGHGLHSCENNVKAISVNNCAFTLKNK